MSEEYYYESDCESDYIEDILYKNIEDRKTNQEIEDEEFFQDFSETEPIEEDEDLTAILEIEKELEKDTIKSKPDVNKIMIAIIDRDEEYLINNFVLSDSFYKEIYNKFLKNPQFRINPYKLKDIFTSSLSILFFDENHRQELVQKISQGYYNFIGHVSNFVLQSYRNEFKDEIRSVGAINMDIEINSDSIIGRKKKQEEVVKKIEEAVKILNEKNINIQKYIYGRDNVLSKLVLTVTFVKKYNPFAIYKELLVVNKTAYYQIVNNFLEREFVALMLNDFKYENEKGRDFDE